MTKVQIFQALRRLRVITYAYLICKNNPMILPVVLLYYLMVIELREPKKSQPGLAKGLLFSLVPSLPLLCISHNIWLAILPFLLGYTFELMAYIAIATEYKRFALKKSLRMFIRYFAFLMVFSFIVLFVYIAFYVKTGQVKNVILYSLGSMAIMSSTYSMRDKGAAAQIGISVFLLILIT